MPKDYGPYGDYAVFDSLKALAHAAAGTPEARILNDACALIARLMLGNTSTVEGAVAVARTVVDEHLVVHGPRYLEREVI